MSVSLALSKVVAISKNIPLYKNIGSGKTLPLPLMNIINGGSHANNSLRIQEFMIRPDKAKTFKEAVNICFLVINKLRTLISGKKLSTSLGDEGGFAPSLSNNEEAIELILKAVDDSGFKAGSDISICLDVAANDLYKEKKYASLKMAMEAKREADRVLAEEYKALGISSLSYNRGFFL